MPTNSKSWDLMWQRWMFYGTLSPDQRNFLEMDGIQVPEKDYPVEVFDLVVSPVHLYPENIMLEHARIKHVPIISHHRAVGEILSIMNIGENLLVIEVTGTKAKTSTASLLGGYDFKELCCCAAHFKGAGTMARWCVPVGP